MFEVMEINQKIQILRDMLIKHKPKNLGELVPEYERLCNRLPMAALAGNCAALAKDFDEFTLKVKKSCNL